MTTTTITNSTTTTTSDYDNEHFSREFIINLIRPPLAEEKRKNIMPFSPDDSIYEDFPELYLNQYHSQSTN